MVYDDIDHLLPQQCTSLGRGALLGLPCENNNLNLNNNNTNTNNNTPNSGGRRRLSTGNNNNLQPSELVGLTREERRRRRRATQKYRTAHATRLDFITFQLFKDNFYLLFFFCIFRERIRVEAFNVAFSDLRKLLPTLPPDKKLSKIEILKLAICYIAYLNHVLET